MANSTQKKIATAEIEICILAGGLSSRMGRDKARLRLGRKTLLAHIRQNVQGMRLPVRVVRRDLVARCGPLGGIYSALKTTSADAVFFLACDMPRVSEDLLRDLLKGFVACTKAVFTWSDDAAGFPFLIRRGALPVIERLIAAKQFSIQTLAKELKGEKYCPSAKRQNELLNVNTPRDWSELLKLFSAGTLDCGGKRSATPLWRG